MTTQNPGYVPPSVAAQEEELAYNFTMGEIRNLIGKTENLLRSITDYFHGVLEGTKQHDILYKKNLEKLNEEIEVLKKHGRSVFSSQMEQMRLGFQSKIAGELMSSLSKLYEPVHELKDFLKEFMQVEEQIRNTVYRGSLIEFVRSRYQGDREKLKTFVEAYSGVNKLAAEYLGAKPNSFVRDILLERKTYEEQTEEMLKLLGEIRDNEKEKIKIPIEEAYYKQEKAATESVKTGLNAVIESSTKLKNLQDDWLYQLYYANDVSVGVRNAFRDIFNTTNIMLNMFKTTLATQKEMIMSIDRVMASFVKGGGLMHRTASGIGGGALMEAIDTARKYGIDESKVSGAGVSLQGEMKEFASLTKNTQRDLMVLLSKFEQLGISASSMARTLNTMTTALKYSTSEAMNTVVSMTEWGMRMGFSIKEITEGWVRATEELSHYGDKAENVFKGLLKHVKETGASLETLIGLEKKFLTFENSADFAGKINAIAGRLVVDPIRLMMATGDEKMTIIEDALRSTNIKDPRGIMFLAQSAGLSATQVKQLMNRIEGKNLEDAGNAFDAVVKSSLELGEKFKALVKEIAVAVSPIVYVLRAILDFLLKINEITGGYLIKGIFWITTLKMGISLFGKLIKNVGIVGNLSGWLAGRFSSFGQIVSGAWSKVKGFVSSLLGIQKAAPAAGGALNNVNQNVQQLTQTGNNAQQGVVGFNSLISSLQTAAKSALQILALGAAIAMVAFSLGYLANSIKGIEQVIGTLVLFSSAVVALIILSKILASASASFAQASFGILLLGFAFIPLAYSFKIFAEAYEKLGLEDMIQLGLGLVALTSAFVASAYIMSLALPILLPALAGFAVLAGILFTISEVSNDIAKKASAIAEALSILASSLLSFVFQMVKVGIAIITSFWFFTTGFSYFKDVINEFIASVNHVEENKLNGFLRLFEMLRSLASYASSFSLIAAGIREIGGAIEEIDSEKVFQTSVAYGSFADSVSPVVRAVDSLRSISGGEVDNLSKFVERAKEISQTINETKENKTMMTLLEKTEKLFSGVGSAFGGQLVVKVVLDERELGRAVIDIIDENGFSPALNK